uniref:Uncharacterized protein n=1 Tax=Romanomermis culicivorax TaxID=13658 RepID=A0A915K544_ROMCU
MHNGNLYYYRTILEHMKSLEMPITEQVCNSLLFANIRAKNDGELQSVLKFMKDNELELTSESYYEMMCAYAENQDFDNIKKILQEHSEVVFTDAQIFNVMYTFLKNGVDYTKDINTPYCTIHIDVISLINQLKGDSKGKVTEFFKERIFGNVALKIGGHQPGRA